MNRPAWVYDDNAAALTDLYQLTMLQAYHAEGMDETAVFDLFVRRLRERNYLLACGLDTVLHYLETFHFSQEALAYLDGLRLFRPAFLDYLGALRFTGDVYAMPEGTPFFPNEPVLVVAAPIGEAQLVETFLLNQITFQTGIASKASRVVRASRGRTVADFGIRRMHGADAALKSARAYHIAGVHATSNVLAGQVYGMQVTGTMAHSYIQAHADELEAFRAFAALYPGTTLLVDTYDTLDGVKKVVMLARALGDAFRVEAIRLDSGDLAELARQARQVLDAAGLQRVRIVASGSLDEHAITELLDRDAPIDGFGVGTRMGTMADLPYLDTAYKLSAYGGEGRMKLSPQKVSLPGRKQVYRLYEDGRAVRDVIARADEALAGTPLLHQVMEDGQRTEAGRATLDAARARARAALDELPERLLALAPAAPPYPVEISTGLRATTDALREELVERMDV
jgi:nicotinate phosphoribosyltransferase